MRIFLKEITDQETELDFTQDEAWVSDAVVCVDEHVEPALLPTTPKKRPISAHFSLRQVDEVMVVSGKIKTHVELVCSRCANLFAHACNINFSALFCKDPVMAGVGHLQRSESDARGTGKPMGQNQGFARHAHNFDDDEDSEQGKDLDITYLSQDYIELGDVLTEQLQLQVPFQPLCKESCKGICSHCGTDLNLGRCACAKIQTTHPFSVLRDFKT
jgi:uncharacterized protein